MRKSLLKRLRAAVSKTSVLSESKRIGIPYSTLHRIVSGKSGGSMRIWEKIEKYFQ